ncbi:MAG: cyclase family protein [Bryobacteraceae bacterium]
MIRFLLPFAFLAAALVSAPHAKVAPAQIGQWMQSLSNWGRWGKEDELGALNLITVEKRRQAAALVRDGVSISLAHEAIKVRADDSPPFEHRMVEHGRQPNAQGASDIFSIQYHGFTVTHLDALCHIFHKGRMYNGYSQTEVSSSGAAKLSAHRMRDGIFTRAVLIDVPRLLRQKYLAGSRAITVEDLEAWEKEAGVKVSSGDAILIRTGRWARRADRGTWDIMKDSAGLHASCLPWLKKRDVAIVGSDLATDVMPSGVEGILLPVHQVLVVAMGVPILDNLDLERVGTECASRRRWEFLLTAAPLSVEGSTGSPINPISTF